MRHSPERGILAAVVVLLTMAPVAAQTPTETQTRSQLGRLLDTAPATPGQRGLVRVALAEAQTALAQAVQAERAANDLAGMRAAGAGVLHAIDPARQQTGPGLGYGVTRAVSELLGELQTLAGSDSRADVARAAPRALTAALEVQQWTATLATLAQQLATAPDVTTATTLSRQAREQAAHILAGPHTAAAATRVPRLQGGLFAVEASLAELYLGREGVLPASVPRAGEPQR